MTRPLLALPLVAAFAACTGPERSTPSVQDSAAAMPRTVISLNRILQGRYRTIAPFCVGQQYLIELPGSGGPGGVRPALGLPIRPGHTVEFRNYMPDAPANVTALRSPRPMYSPNLVRPYNLATEAGETFSYWRYTFVEPGAYEYFDTNMGSPGRPVVDSYYGTVTYIGESDAPKGMVCVDAPGCVESLDCLNGVAPTGTPCCTCPGVCCTTDQNCNTGRTCLRGRCVDRETGE